MVRETLDVFNLILNAVTFGMIAVAFLVYGRAHQDMKLLLENLRRTSMLVESVMRNVEVKMEAAEPGVERTRDVG